MSRFATAIAIVMTLCATTARADMITDWNQNAIAVLKAGNVGGNPWSRAMAMVHVAMCDAVNSVEAKYTRFAATAPTAPKASAEAAAASAARQILTALVPAQKAKIDEIYAESLNRIPDGAAKTDGIALGEQVAALIQADRATDATNEPDTYRPITSPGVWVPTQPPLFPQYAHAKPWGIKSADQFRPGPPPKLTSAIYARDYNEIKELGGTKSTKRTQQQTDAVRFWTQLNFGPSWHEAARQLSAGKALNLADNARLFALLNMTIANTFITDWDAKFLQRLAADHRDPQRRQRRQRRDRARCRLDAVEHHPDAPGVPLPGGHPGRRGGRRARIRVRHRAVSGIYRDGFRRCPPATSVHQHRANGRRDEDGTHLGRHSFPQHGGNQRSDGQKDHRVPDQQLHDAGSLKRSS